MTPALTPAGDTHVNVLQGENHRLVNEHAAGLLVDGGGDDVGVDGHRRVAAVGLVAHHDGGVFRAEELAQVLVEHKDELGHPWRRAGKK